MRILYVELEDSPEFGLSIVLNESKKEGVLSYQLLVMMHSAYGNNAKKLSLNSPITIVSKIKSYQRKET
jgi:hypothetical protein